MEVKLIARMEMPSVRTCEKAPHRIVFRMESRAPEAEQFYLSDSIAYSLANIFQFS